MTPSLLDWKNLYEKSKFQARCIDIECAFWNGPISVMGIYTPKEGPVECISLIKGISLSTQRVMDALQNVKLFITYNGLKFDIPKIKTEFPGVVPNVPVLDLYLFARKLNLNTNLKVLENTFGVFRPESVDQRRRIAVKLWKSYQRTKREKTLQTLIEYNRQDTINLYPLAEQLMKMIS